MNEPNPFIYFQINLLEVTTNISMFGLQQGYECLFSM